MPEPLITNDLIGRLLVNPAGKGRMRLDPLIVPELICWLKMVSENNRRMLASFTQAMSLHDSPVFKTTMTSCRAHEKCINSLIRMTNDTFSARDWRRNWDELCEAFAIQSQSNKTPIETPILYNLEGDGI